MAGVARRVPAGAVRSLRLAENADCRLRPRGAVADAAGEEHRRRDGRAGRARRTDDGKPAQCHIRQRGRAHPGHLSAVERTCRAGEREHQRQHHCEPLARRRRFRGFRRNSLPHLAFQPYRGGSERLDVVPRGGRVGRADIACYRREGARARAPFVRRDLGGPHRDVRARAPLPAPHARRIPRRTGELARSIARDAGGSGRRRASTCAPGGASTLDARRCAGRLRRRNRGRERAAGRCTGGDAARSASARIIRRRRDRGGGRECGGAFDRRHLRSPRRHGRRARHRLGIVETDRPLRRAGARFHRHPARCRHGPCLPPG